MPLLTIVFTDVVESSATKRDVSLGRDNRERDHAYLEKVQSRHFELIRESYRARGGTEVSTMGDAFYLTFDDPVEAVRCAIDIQKRLNDTPIDTPRGPLRLRIGIHTGLPEPFEGSLHGTDVDSAARVEAAATERQILLSSSTYELVRHMTDVKFHRLGEFSLKGIDRMALWEADWDGKGPRPTSVPPILVTPRKMDKRGVIAVVTLVVLLAAAAVGYHFVHRTERVRQATAPGVKPRRSVAVLGFKNVSGRAEEAWLSTALSEMLTTELAAGEQLRTVPGESVSQMKIDLALPEADSFAKETLARIGKNLDSDDVVLGSYIPLGAGQVRLDFRLQDTSSGETLAAISKKGAEAQLDEIVASAGADLREKLGAGAISPGDAAAVKASLPENPETARLYSKGLMKLRVFDALSARELFEKVVAGDPRFALGHSELASAWATLGYDANAEQEAKKAFELSAKLPREQRLWVEGRYREATHDWAKAIEVYKTLRDFFPDNLDYGLRLAVAQSSASQGKDALLTIEELRKLPPPARDDPRINLAESGAQQALGNFQQAQEAGEVAASKGEAQGARLLVAHARLSEGDALQRMGKTKDAIARAEEAKRLFTEAGDRHGVAAALANIGNFESAAGDAAGAKRVWEQSLSISREIGNQAGIANGLNAVAVARWQSGDLAGAKLLFDQSLAIRQKIGDTRRAAQTMNSLAGLLHQQGDLSGAQQMVQNGLEVYRRIGDKSSTGAALSNLGLLQQEQGNLPAARATYEEALVLYKEIGETSGVASTLNGLANILLRQSKLSEAQALYERSLAAYNEIGEKQGILEVDGNLGNLLYDMGDLVGARKRYEQSLATAREIGDKSEIASALSNVANVIETGGDLVGARKDYEEALAMRKAIGEKGEMASSWVSLATLSIEEGHAPAAQQPAREAAEEFKKERSDIDEAGALGVLAHSLLMQGKVSGAESTVRRARSLVEKSGDIEHRLPVLILAARIDAAAGRAAAAEQSLGSLLEQATAVGNVPLTFDARLALAEVESKAGKAAGREQLSALEKDATARGFLLIAREARASLESTATPGGRPTG
jgi:tetratricopeptide (TPR) repeat protein/class 3 adenylate cyclase